METESGFFNHGDIGFLSQDGVLRLIHESNRSFTRVYTLRRNGRMFCLKCLREQYMGDMSAAIALRKEYDLASRLDHVSVTRTFDFINYPGLGNAILMEWYDAPDIATLLNDGYTFTREDIDSIVVQCADAIDAIHRTGVVHRDIKPSNVLFGKSVKIIDFGMADATDYYAFKGVAGTDGYVPPHVLNGSSRPSSPQVDFYALGQTLNCILSNIKDNKTRRRLECIARSLKEGRYESGKAIIGAWHMKSHAYMIPIIIVLLVSSLIAVTTFFIRRGNAKDLEQPVNKPELLIYHPSDSSSETTTIAELRHKAKKNNDFESKATNEDISIPQMVAGMSHIASRDPSDWNIVHIFDSLMLDCVNRSLDESLQLTDRHSAWELYYDRNAMTSTAANSAIASHPNIDRSHALIIADERYTLWMTTYAALHEPAETSVNDE